MKRKLELLPEVLPAPKPRASGAPRERTLERLRQLMTGAAITTVALGASARAPDGKDDKPQPPPPRPQGVHEGEWHTQHASPDAGPATAPTYGYGVVDPMPPPARGCGCHKPDPPG